MDDRAFAACAVGILVRRLNGPTDQIRSDYFLVLPVAAPMFLPMPIYMAEQF